jgi:hypothetical protein
MGRKDCTVLIFYSEEILLSLVRKNHVSAVMFCEFL